MVDTPLTLRISRSYNPTTLRDEIERPGRQLSPRGRTAPRCERAVRRTWPTKKEALVSKELATRALFATPWPGASTAARVLRRAAALGVSAPVAAALAQETMRAALASEEGKPNTTFYYWMPRDHPMINTIGEEQGVTVEIAPTENFGFDRFVAEANEENSTWDSYGGVTPFLEMIALVNTGTIEPWDEYLPEGMIDDFAPASRSGRRPGTASSTSGRCCSTSACRRCNADLVEKAGLDPEVAPKTWDEFIENARTVQESGVAPYGLVFDNRDWRSLIPITHSISTDVYTPDGLFMYDSEPAIQALEILGRMMELTIPDVLAPGEPSASLLADEAAFTGAAGGLLLQVPELAAAVRLAVARPLQAEAFTAPGSRRWRGRHGLLGHRRRPLQVWQEQGAGRRLLHCPLDRRADLAGTASSAIQRRESCRSGQLPVLQSVWAAWEDNPPEWMTANPWTLGDLRQSRRRQRNRSVDPRRSSSSTRRGRNGTSTSPAK